MRNQPKPNARQRAAEAERLERRRATIRESVRRYRARKKLAEADHVYDVEPGDTRIYEELTP